MSTIRVLPQRDMWLPGETLRGTVELRVDRPLRARGVRLRFRGHEETRVTHGSGKNRHTHREHVQLIDTEITFAGEERITDALEGFGDAVRALFGGDDYLHIPVGDQSFDFEMALPESCAVSFEGKCAKVAYELTGYVDVPAGSDVKHARPVYILPPPVAKLEQRPVAIDYPDGGHSWGVFEGLRAALAPNVRMRTELPQATYAVGDVIRGRLSAWNDSEARIRRVDVSLVAQEDARAGHASARITDAVDHVEFPAPVLSDFGTDLALQIPPNAHPSTAGSFFTYNWAIKVWLDIAWQFDVVSVAPIVVLAAGRS
jgi:hypothetical protein